MLPVPPLEEVVNKRREDIPRPHRGLKVVVTQQLLTHGGHAVRVIFCETPSLDKSEHQIFRRRLGPRTCMALLARLPQRREHERVLLCSLAHDHVLTSHNVKIIDESEPSTFVMLQKRTLWVTLGFLCRHVPRDWTTDHTCILWRQQQEMFWLWMFDNRIPRGYTSAQISTGRTGGSIK